MHFTEHYTTFSFIILLIILVAGNFNVSNFAVLNMLNEADPTAPESGDPPELAGAEEGVINSMAPLIDTGKIQWHPMPVSYN